MTAYTVKTKKNIFKMNVETTNKTPNSTTGPASTGQTSTGQTSAGPASAGPASAGPVQLSENENITSAVKAFANEFSKKEIIPNSKWRRQNKENLANQTIQNFIEIYKKNFPQASLFQNCKTIDDIQKEKETTLKIKEEETRILGTNFEKFMKQILLLEKNFNQLKSSNALGNVYATKSNIKTLLKALKTLKTNITKDIKTNITKDIKKNQTNKKGGAKHKKTKRRNTKRKAKRMRKSMRKTKRRHKSKKT